MDTFSSKIYSVALLYLITATFSVSAISTLTYSCFTGDGKYYVDGCVYFSFDDEPIDVDSITVGCCMHTNITDTLLSCAILGSFCSSGTFGRVYLDNKATPPTRTSTTRAPSTPTTPTTTAPPWYYRRTTTTRYRWNTRTTTQYRSYRRPTTAYSSRSRYRRTSTYRSTYSSSNVNTYRIAGGVGSAALLIIAIISYCCKRKRANAEQTDNHISAQYSGADSIPMPTRSYNSNRQYSADGTQEINNPDHQAPSYDEVTNNINAYHTPISPTYPSAPTGTNAPLGPGTAYLLRSSERHTAAGNEDLPNVASPSNYDVTKPPEH